MTTIFLLDWAILAVSIINVILLLWLGLTLLLNAEERTVGVWLASSGLLLATLFFISHSAILGYGLDYESFGLNVWWRMGWLPLTIIPFIWYLVILWYVGRWDEDNQQTAVHDYWIYWLGGWCLGLLIWLIVANPLPSFVRLAWLRLDNVPQLLGQPIFLIIYPAYIVTAMTLSLWTLKQASHATYIVDSPSRQRAMPWLVAMSVTLVGVSLIVAAVIGWILLNVSQPILFDVYTRGMIIAWIDLLIASLIIMSVILLGQAVVSFELFTDKALPRTEFQRQWWNAIILAVGFGVIVSGAVTLQLRPIYILLLSTLLMTLFYALSSWRASTWRARYIHQLRPFVTSQRLYDHLFASAPSEVQVDVPFQALCAEVLQAEQAYLLAVGPLAPFVTPLSYPTAHEAPPIATLPKLLSEFRSSTVRCVPLTEGYSTELRWAIPLWNERGLIGVFMLGAKQRGRLFTQEEIEIAQASGERLIDAQATAEIARRLITLQRQRLVESQLLDQQTRRVLHDDVLPDLHAALLSLSSGHIQPATLTTLSKTHHQLSNLLRDMPTVTLPALDRLGLIGALKQLTHGELASVFEQVQWQLDHQAVEQLKQLPDLSTTVLFYAARELIRNAAKHGRGNETTQPLCLTITVSNHHGLTLMIEDNGVGFINLPRQSVGGQGLMLHSTMLAVIGASLTVESVVGQFTQATIALPLEPKGFHETTSPHPEPIKGNKSPPRPLN